MALYDCDGVTIIISTEIFLFYLDIGSVSMPMNFSSNGTSSSCKSSVEGALMGSRPTGCVYHLLIKKKKVLLTGQVLQLMERRGYGEEYINRYKMMTR